MSRPLRLAVVVAAAVVAFGLCLWLGRSVSFSWMPQADALRWGIVTAFATVVATIVGTAVISWTGQAGQGKQSVQGSTVGGGISQVSGTDGNVRITRRGPAAPPPGPVSPTMPSGTVTPEADGQSVRDTSTAGPVDQVQNTGGDVEIEGP